MTSSSGTGGTRGHDEEGLQELLFESFMTKLEMVHSTEMPEFSGPDIVTGSTQSHVQCVWSKAKHRHPHCHCHVYILSISLPYIYNQSLDYLGNPKFGCTAFCHNHKQTMSTGPNTA